MGDYSAAFGPEAARSRMSWLNWISSIGAKICSISSPFSESGVCAAKDFTSLVHGCEYSSGSVTVIVSSYRARTFLPWR